MTETVTPYKRAVDAAAELRRIAPNHELLRLISEERPEAMERFTQERIDRFVVPKKGEDLDILPASVLENRSFDGLADAMHTALKEKGRSTVKVGITRIKLHANPPAALFNVELNSCHPDGYWSHTAPSQEHLDVFLKGIQAGAGCLGVHVSIPDIPGEHAALDAYIRQDEIETI